MHTSITTLLPLLTLLTPTLSLPQAQSETLYSTLLPRDGPGKNPNTPSGCSIETFTADHGCPNNKPKTRGSGIYNADITGPFFSYRLGRDLRSEEALDLFTPDGVKHPATGEARAKGCHDTPGGMARYHFWIPN